MLGPVASRRLPLALALASLASLASAPGRPGRAEEPGRPGIVVVLVDDFDATLYGHLPQLQAGGLVFEHFVYSQSLCCPSRATILSGRHPWNHRVRANAPPRGGRAKFRDDEPEAIGVQLQLLGYRTGYIGRYLTDYREGDVPPGWDEWRADLSEAGKYGSRRASVNGRARRVRRYSTDYTREQGVRFLRSARVAGAPPFLVLAPHAPHGPARPAERHAAAEFPGAEGFHRQKLRSMLAVLELLGAVREAAGPGAYLFFLSDNGYHYAEGGGRGGKGTAYSTDSVVPMVAWGPGVPPGRAPELASTADLLPTITELAGGKVERDGLSLAPLLRGEHPGGWRGYVPMQNYGRWAIRSAAHLHIAPRELYAVGAEGPEANLWGRAESELPAVLRGLKRCAGAACNPAPASTASRPDPAHR
jgi:N-acetylglucosamine-6-sulfatase